MRMRWGNGRRWRLFEPSYGWHGMLLWAVMLCLLACGGLQCALIKAPRVEPIESNLEQAGVQGQEVQLSNAVLFIPDFFKPRSDTVDIIVHFHGAAWLAERNFYQVRKNAVLVAVHFPGFSSAYSRPFSDPQLFQQILDETLNALKERGIVGPDARVGRICLTAFSAGYGAIREILHVPAYYEKITDLVLADSVHCSYTDDKQLNDEQMAPFLQFARDAAAAKKTMCMTHSSIQPPGYASTTETSDYLIVGVGGQRHAASGIEGRGMRLISAFDKGNFHVRGYTGNTKIDHMDHFYSMAIPLAQISFNSAGGE
jgi:hypothetical protein